METNFSDLLQLREKNKIKRTFKKTNKQKNFMKLGI